MKTKPKTDRGEVHRLHQLEIRRRESRQLLHRLVKYVREDAAATPGTTRLARLTEQVIDYLNRTSEPNDILRANEAAGQQSQASWDCWVPVGERLPVDGQRILALANHGEMRSGTYDWETRDVNFPDDFWHMNGNQVSHWMPIPPPPAPQQKGE
jgi:hypothetical protein